MVMGDDGGGGFSFSHRFLLNSTQTSFGRCCALSLFLIHFFVQIRFPSVFLPFSVLFCNHDKVCFFCCFFFLSVCSFAHTNYHPMLCFLLFAWLLFCSCIRFSKPLLFFTLKFHIYQFQLYVCVCFLFHSSQCYHIWCKWKRENHERQRMQK